MDTFIHDWISCPFPLPGEAELYVRSTPVNHGVVINLANPMQPRWDETEFSSRRYSMILKLDGEWQQPMIIDISYHDGFDTLNQPVEIFKKIMSGEYTLLYHANLDGNVKVTQLSDWNGMAQSLDIR